MNVPSLDYFPDLNSLTYSLLPFIALHRKTKAVWGETGNERHIIHIRWMTVLIMYVWICLLRNPTRFFFLNLHICISSLNLGNCIFAACKILCFKNIKTSRNIYLKNKLHSCTFIRKSKDRTCKVRKCKVIIIKMTYSVFTFVAEVKHHCPHVHLFQKYWKTT